MSRAPRPIPLRSLATAAALLPFLAGACSEAPETPTGLCARILIQRFPDAKVRATLPSRDPHRPRLLFEAAPQDGFSGTGRFACDTRESRHGTLRVDSAEVDDRPLSGAELALINADLLLEDIRAAAPHPAPPQR